MTPEQRKSYAQALVGQKSGATWTNIPPALSGYQVQGTSGATGLGIVGLGKYRMPDGSHQVSWGLAQPALDAYRSMRYGLGFEQDPDAPAGYVSEDAISRGAFGAAGMAATGGIAATTAARAAGRPIVPNNAAGVFGFGKKSATPAMSTLDDATIDRLHGLLQKPKASNSNPGLEKIYAGGAAGPSHRLPVGGDSNTRVYHGTNARDFDKFMPPKATTSGRDDVTFFSDDPTVASYFAEADEAFASGKSRVYSADIDKNAKIFDFNNPDHIKMLPKEYMSKLSDEEINRLHNGHWKSFDSPEMRKILRDNGFNGWIEVEDASRGLTYAMFNDGKVKSPYTNQTLWSSGVPGIHVAEDE